MKTFLSIILFCASGMVFATGPRVTSALLTPPVNEIFALDFPLALGSDLAEGGIAAALITEAFKTEQVESTITPLPLQTMVTYYLTQENALGIVGHDLNLSAVDSKNIILVPVLSMKESYFYYRPKHATLTWRGNLDDFKNLVVGTHKDDMALSQQSNIKVEQDRLDTRIKALISGKIDVVRESDLSMATTLAKSFADQKDNIVRLEPSAGNAVISVAFNKKNPKGTALAKQFQQGLAKLISSGKYTDIIKSYIGNAAVEQYFVPLKK